MICQKCRTDIPDNTVFCGHCGTRQDQADGWFRDPLGYWDARYFQKGEWTHHIMVAGTPYLEPRINWADTDRSRVEEILVPGERLLFEAQAFWKGKIKYQEDDGIFALTTYRVLKYRTGNGSMSTKRGHGPLHLHWSVVCNRQFLDLLAQRAAAGDPRAAETQRRGVQVLTGYRSEPVVRDRKHRDLVGSMQVTLRQERVLQSAGNIADVLDRWTRSASRTGKMTPFGQSNVENRDLILDLLGYTPVILRLDQLLAAAAASMAAAHAAGAPGA